MKNIIILILFFIFSSFSQEFRITNSINENEWPEVDPYNKEIYYSVTGSTRGIYKILINGGAPELTPFYNMPAFFKTEHKAAYLSETDSLVLFDFDINSKTNLAVINDVSNFWISISPNENKLFHFEKAPSYYSLIDSTYYTLPFPPFAPECYPFSRIQWKDEYNLVFIKYEGPFDTIVVNFNYLTNQLDTIFHLNRVNSGIWGIAYNPVYNLLAYSFNTPTFYTYVSLFDLNTLQDNLILYPDTTQSYYILSVTEMVWNDSGSKLAIIGNHPTAPIGDLFLYDYIQNKLDTLTVYPFNNDGNKHGLRWFGEDTIIYSKYVYDWPIRCQIFGFNTNYSSNLNQQNLNSLYSFQLQQNYPNPFNLITTISYKVKESGKIKLLLFDVSGQELEVLLDEHQPPGEYNFQYDAKDRSSGIYFYRLIVNDNPVATKKMVLLK